MSRDQYLQHDIEGERRATVERKAALLKAEIDAKTIELQGLEAQLERLTKSVR